jgi:hypothetical protein
MSAADSGFCDAATWWIGDTLFCAALILLARHGRDLSVLLVLKARIRSADAEGEP